MPKLQGLFWIDFEVFLIVKGITLKVNGSNTEKDRWVVYLLHARLLIRQKEIMEDEGGSKMYCKKCGKELDEGAVYCSYCGEKQMDGEKSCTEEESSNNTDGYILGNVEKENSHENAEGEIICPHCRSSNIKHVKRMGCLGFLGELCGGIVTFIVIGAIDIIWLSRLYGFLFIISFIINIVVLIRNKQKEKWTWDIECESCGKKFEWDPTIKKIVR